MTGPTIQAQLRAAVSDAYYDDGRTMEQAADSAVARLLPVLDAYRGEVLREAAEDIRTNAARAWGGNSSVWMTTGSRVAELVGEWLDGSVTRDD